MASAVKHKHYLLSYEHRLAHAIALRTKHEYMSIHLDKLVMTEIKCNATHQSAIDKEQKVHVSLITTSSVSRSDTEASISDDRLSVNTLATHIQTTRSVGDLQVVHSATSAELYGLVRQ